MNKLNTKVILALRTKKETIKYLNTNILLKSKNLETNKQEKKYNEVDFIYFILFRAFRP